MLRVVIFAILFVCESITLTHPLIAQTNIELSDTAKVDRVRLRVEVVDVSGGAQLVIIVAQMKDTPDELTDIPLTAVLRDTLGDDEPENDKLRYLWDFSYARPSWRQRFASAIPFFYFHPGSQTQGSRNSLSPLIDLSPNRNKLYLNWAQQIIGSATLKSQGLLFGPSLRTHERNTQDHRQAHIARAYEVFSMLGKQTRTESGTLSNSLPPPPILSPVLSGEEIQVAQARLGLSGRKLGEIIDKSRLHEAHQKQQRQSEEWRDRNWELLRQRAEAEGLYFEPLLLPDSTATHAILWISRSELEATYNKHQPRRFNSRFLSISNPWRDKKLLRWEGYSETRWFDTNNRLTTQPYSGANEVEMIPLALYGLEYPRIPILLVDFRNNLNPKRRETSGRAIKDVTRYIFSISRFGNLYFFAGQAALNFLMHRRGVDFNQPSRLQALAKLRLLLALDQSMPPSMRSEIAERLRGVTINPLDNDWQAEAKLARQQYATLLDYARRENGLSLLLQHDRSAEIMPISHGRAARVALKTINILSFGLYTHREQLHDGSIAQLGIKRQIDFHKGYLRDVVGSKARIDVGWDLNQVRRSLTFLMTYDSSNYDKLAHLSAQIFNMVDDKETRELALQTLSHLHNQEARNELTHLIQDSKLESEWREKCTHYLIGTFSLSRRD